MTVIPDQVPCVASRVLAGDALQLYRQCESELSQVWLALPDKPAETPANTVAALWHAAAGIPLSVQRASEASLPPLSPAGIERLRELFAKRLKGVPLAHITGRQQFMGIEFLVSTDALIPRAETELLGYAALEQLHAIVQVRQPAVVIDVCTGSGNLALALACHEPHSRVWGADLSADAVALAQRNAIQQQVTDRVSFLAGDLLAPFDYAAFHGKVDLLVCNPPYISSAKVDSLPGEIIRHEPRLAFDGGPLGIRILQRLINEAPRVLSEDGWLAFEVGHGQGRGMRRRIEQHGAYADVCEITDQHGEVRALMARHTLPVSAEGPGSHGDASGVVVHTNES